MSTAARTATNATTNPATEHKPILAERFKTKPCQNFEKTGVCPYETRCMFAHGEHDLRTKEMNLAANLVTEEAIKNFQRERMIAEREAALAKTKGGKKAAGPKKPAVASPLTKKALAAPQPVAAAAVDKSEKRVAPAGPKQAAAVPAPIVVAEPQRPSSPASDSPSTVAAPKSPRATPSSTTASTPMKKLSASTTTPARRYRHDPYAPVVIGVPVSAEPLPEMQMTEEDQYAAYGYYQAACMCADCASPSSTVAASPLAQAMMYKQIATKYPEPCYCADCCRPDTMAEHAEQILLC